MKTILVTGLIAGVLLATPAIADDPISITGEDLLTCCEGTGLKGAAADARLIQCAAYIEGVVDGLSIGSDPAQASEGDCVPAL